MTRRQRWVLISVVFLLTAALVSACAPHRYALVRRSLHKAEKRLDTVTPDLRERWPQKVTLIERFIDDGYDALRPPLTDVHAARIYADLAHGQLDDFSQERMTEFEDDFKPLLSPTQPANLEPSPDTPAAPMSDADAAPPAEMNAAENAPAAEMSPDANTAPEDSTADMTVDDSPAPE